MHGIVDRIEDAKVVVISIEGGGQIIIPVSQFNFEVYEGAHLDIDFKLNPEKEENMHSEIKNLQDELLKKSQEENEDKK